MEITRKLKKKLKISGLFHFTRLVSKIRVFDFKLSADFDQSGYFKSIGTELVDLEPKANGCRDVLVWHTKTKKVQVPRLSFKKANMTKWSNMRLLVGNLINQGVIINDTERGLEVWNCFHPNECL